MAKKKAEKTSESSVKEAVKKIKARFGNESIMMLEDKPNVDIEVLTTGSIGLDHAIGIWGLPRGRIIEVFGPESSGKTTIALHVIAEAQKQGMECAFIDAEHSMDPQYAKRLGVQTDKLMISQPSNGEEALQIADELIRSKIGVVVVDSVAALTPKAVIEGEIGEVKIGALARLMSQSLNMLKGTIAKSNTIVIFINQTRMNIAAMATWGAPPETTTGGKALKFYADLRLEVKRIGQLKKGDDVVGGRTRVKVIKNKVAPPFKQAEFDILFNKGISKEAEVLALGEAYGIVEKASSGAYTWGDTKLGRGADSAREFLEENNQIFDAIRQEVVNKIKTE